MQIVQVPRISKAFRLHPCPGLVVYSFLVRVAHRDMGEDLCGGDFVHNNHGPFCFLKNSKSAVLTSRALLGLPEGFGGAPGVAFHPGYILRHEWMATRV